MTKTCYDSPALQTRSEHYPASWHQKVPKRIKMSKTVMSDLPMFRFQVPMRAVSGMEYECWVNSHGALCAILDHGEGDNMLGLKPYEFEVIGWHEVSE